METWFGGTCGKKHRPEHNGWDGAGQVNKRAWAKKQQRGAREFRRPTARGTLPRRSGPGQNRVDRNR